jgi:hypothetical protein
MLRCLARTEVFSRSSGVRPPVGFVGVLDGIRVKLDRADEHLLAFNDEVPRFLESDPFEMRATLDVERRRYSVQLRVLRQPPRRWAAIAGDFIQNTRAALDHLVWALVLLNGEEPSRQNQFRILDQEPTSTRSRQAWDQALAGVSDGAQERIALAQPYQRDDGPEHHVLYGLREMSNTDKHRTLLVTATAIPEHSTPTLQFRGIRDVGEFGRYGVHVDGPLRDGQEVAFIEDVDVRGADPVIKVSGHLPFMVAFGEDLTTLTGLRQTRDYVRWLVDEAFGPLFAASTYAEPSA